MNHPKVNCTHWAIDDLFEVSFEPRQSCSA